MMHRFAGVYGTSALDPQYQPRDREDDFCSSSRELETNPTSAGWRLLDRAYAASRDGEGLRVNASGFDARADESQRLAYADRRFCRTGELDGLGRRLARRARGAPVSPKRYGRRL